MRFTRKPNSRARKTLRKRGGASAAPAKETPKVFVLGIVGMSGSGKTSVATALESNPCIKGVVDNIVIISADDYYKIPNRKGHESAPNFRKENPTHWDTPEAYDIDLLNAHIIALKKGETIRVPAFQYPNANNSTSWWSRKEGTEITLQGNTLLIVEGLFLFHNEDFIKTIDAGIFLKPSKPEYTEPNYAFYRNLERYYGIKDKNITELNASTKSNVLAKRKSALNGFEKYIVPLYVTLLKRNDSKIEIVDIPVYTQAKRNGQSNKNFKTQRWDFVTDTLSKNVCALIIPKVNTAFRPTGI